MDQGLDGCLTCLKGEEWCFACAEPGHSTVGGLVHAPIQPYTPERRGSMVPALQDDGTLHWGHTGSSNTDSEQAGSSGKGNPGHGKAAISNTGSGNAGSSSKGNSNSGNSASGNAGSGNAVSRNAGSAQVMLPSVWDTPAVVAALRIPEVMVVLAAVMLPSARWRTGLPGRWHTGIPGWCGTGHPGHCRLGSPRHCRTEQELTLGRQLQLL
ncbi:UNVERIFIED_CONTAM: hypothetical protein FKN15_029732 [Acipenser sinensis]